MPILLHALVEAQGWRHAWLWLALVVGVGFGLVALLFYRDSPEGSGLKPDGPLAGRALGSRRERGATTEFTLAEARRTYSFWAFSLGLALFGLYITGLSFHIASIFETSGLDPARGFSIFLPAAIVSVVLRPFVGWLCDRLPLKILLGSMQVGLGLSALGLCLLAPGRSLWILILGNGLCSSTFGTLATVTWPDFFGRRHLGAISGLNMSVMVFASAVGPWLFGQCQALTGSYRGVALGVLASAVVLLVAAHWGNSPQPGTQTP